MAISCSMLVAMKPEREQDPTGRYNEYGMYGQADI